MAPVNSSSYKLPSLQKIAGMQNGRSTSLTRKPERPQFKAALLKATPTVINDDDDDSSSAKSDSDSESDGDDNANWVKKIANPSATHSPAKAKASLAKRDEVADSDQERDKKHSALNGKKAKAASSTSASSDSSSESDEDSSSSGADKTAAAPTKQSTTTTSDSDVSSDASDSSESESESDESEMATEPNLKKSKAMVNGVKAAENVYDMIDSDEDEEENEDEAEADNSQNSEEAAASSSDSESESDEAAEDSGMAVAVAKTGAVEVHKGEPATIGQDFVLQQAVGNEDITKVAQLFQEAVATGKQIWYFTAPESVPLSLVEEFEFPLDSQDGSTVLSRDGQTFVTDFDNATKNSIKLLINSDGQRYKQTPVSVDRVMHVKRITKLPGTDSTLNLTVTNIKSPQPRPQPPGLKARFQPIGVSGSHVGQIGMEESPKAPESRDIEMTDAVASQTGSAKKSKQPVFKMPPEDTTVEQPKEKKKKTKEASGLSLFSSAAPPSFVDTHPLSQATPSKKKDKAVAKSTPTTVSPVPPPVKQVAASCLTQVASLEQEASAPNPQPAKAVYQEDDEPEKRSKKDRSEKREKKKKKKLENAETVATPAPKQAQPIESPPKSTKRKRIVDDDIEDDDEPQPRRELTSPEKKAKKARFEKEPSVDLSASSEGNGAPPAKQPSPAKPLKSALKSTPLRDAKAASPVPNPHLAALVAASSSSGSAGKPKTPVAKPGGGGGVKVKKEGGGGGAVPAAKKKPAVTLTPVPAVPSSSAASRMVTPVPLPTYAVGRK